MKNRGGVTCVEVKVTQQQVFSCEGLFLTNIQQYHTQLLLNIVIHCMFVRWKHGNLNKDGGHIQEKGWQWEVGLKQTHGTWPNMGMRSDIRTGKSSVVRRQREYSLLLSWLTQAFYPQTLQLYRNRCKSTLTRSSVVSAQTEITSLMSLKNISTFWEICI